MRKALKTINDGAFIIALVMLISTMGVFMTGRLAFIEGKLLPVVTDFRITKMEAVGDTHTRFWGTFNLERPECDYIKTPKWKLLGRNRDVAVPLIIEERTTERISGVNEFGPWIIKLTPEQFISNSLGEVTHDCPLRWWYTSTELIPEYYPTK